MEAETQSTPAITGLNALRPKNLRAIFAVKKANFRKGIQSKENFKHYIRTPGSDADPNGSWSWVNEGTRLP